MSQNFDFTSYNNIKRLPEDELTELWGRYLSDKTNKQLRDTLIVQYIYLVRYVVGRVRVTLPATVSIEDIAGYGIEGLINAIERYSVQKNTRFETYALIRIRGAIIDKIREEDFLPRSIRKKIKDIKNAQEALKQELGRMPTTKEVADYLEMDPEKINQLLAEDTTMTSIYDKKGTSEDSVEIIDTIEDTNTLNPQEKAEEKNVKSELERALKKLPERERVIMVLYYQENMTLKEIGETINVSESRVCQLHAQAIMKLKNIFSESRASRLQQSIVA
ncbi:FliA/WhiG family RNA polymerase sigma factor [bacterium]|nr:FliA/WhiG family RNA polymerase sigma factor [bacterium]